MRFVVRGIWAMTEGSKSRSGIGKRLFAIMHPNTIRMFKLPLCYERPLNPKIKTDGVKTVCIDFNVTSNVNLFNNDACIIFYDR